METRQFPCKVVLLWVLLLQRQQDCCLFTSGQQLTTMQDKNVNFATITETEMVRGFQSDRSRVKLHFCERFCNQWKNK